MNKIHLFVLCAALFLLSACSMNENITDTTANSSTTVSESNQTDESLAKVVYEEIPQEYRAQASEQGTMEVVSYSSENGTKEAYVYLPYGYDSSDEDTKYEILYLMHGGGGSSSTYFGTPSSPNYLKNTVDHLIEDKRIEPLIIVLPTFYPQGDRDSSVSNASRFTKDFPEELVNDLIPAVESTYHTYAEDTDKEGLKASREHRAFGGFSMGSVTTWYVFHDSLEYVSTFLPSSGDSWLEGEYGGANSSEQTAQDLADAVTSLGYGTSDFQIYASTGTDDIAYRQFDPQINAMKELSDVFVFAEEKGQGNLYYNLAEGRTHDFASAADYFYDGLLFLYGMDGDQEGDETMNGTYRTEELYAINENKNIYGEIYIPNDTSKTKFPAVILSHGFGSSHRNLEDYARRLAESGYVAYIYDFSGGGYGSKSDGTMLDMSLLTEREDLKAVVSMIKEQNYVDTNNIFLAGASQGGAVSAITAPQIRDDVKGMILFYPALVIVDDVHKTFSSVDDVPDTYSIMGMRVGRRYATDVFDMDIYDEISGFDKDVLIIHGDKDGIVPIRYSQEALKVYQSAELITMSGAGHVFYGSDREASIDDTIEWLDRHVHRIVTV